jgi:hypothetical protein
MTAVIQIMQMLVVVVQEPLVAMVEQLQQVQPMAVLV